MKFQTDSPFFQFLGTLTDFVLLNLIFLITCIPIITIGPAICALFSITLREAREEHGYIVQPYLKSFRENFKSSFVLYLIYILLGALLLFSYIFWLQAQSIPGAVAAIILTVCVLLYLMSAFYVFALNARFENSLLQTIKNSILLALIHPKQTLQLLLLTGIAVLLYIVTGIFRVFLLIFGFAFLAYCASFPLTKVFTFYEEQEDTNA